MLKYPDLPISTGKRVAKGIFCPLLSIHIHMSSGRFSVWGGLAAPVKNIEV
jgi:hypothetical protein